jgi:hypothetical protein
MKLLCWKQTNRHCDVVRWPEVFTANYTPPQMPEQKDLNRWSANAPKRSAGIQIIRHSGRKVFLSGALSHIDGLAFLLRYRVNVTLAT